MNQLDDNGEQIIEIPLSNSERKVKLYQRDYNDLINMGVGPPWILIQDQVKVYHKGTRYLPVARLLLDADKGINVRFKDKDATNLCRSNLIRKPGQAQFRARDQLAQRPVS